MRVLVAHTVSSPGLGRVGAEPPGLWLAFVVIIRTQLEIIVLPIVFHGTTRRSLRP